MASLGRAGAVMFAFLTFAASASAASCPRGATCGRVTVPLDHSGATPGTLSIAYARLPATDTRAGTLVLLSGGPGQAAIPLTRQFAALVEPLRATYDLVTVDQRGTGASGAVSCRFDLPIADCAAKLGARRALFNTPETAEDLDDLRRALGVEKLTPLGVSYGAAVAGEYARRHPEHTAAVVLDSPVPVDGLDGTGVLRAAALPRVLREICFPGACHATVPDPAQALARAIKRGSAPQGVLYDVIAISDRIPGLRAGLPAAIASLSHGDTRPLAHLVQLFGASETARVNTARLLATDCIESLLPWAPDSPVASRSLSMVDAAALAPFSTAAVLRSAPAGTCIDWPPTPRPQLAPSAGPNVPVLVISGREDLRTPLESARRTAAQYPNATLLAVPGAGHSVLRTSACARTALASFLHGGPVAPCRRGAGELRAAPYAPRTLSALRPTRLTGLRGRVFSAVTVTLTGVGYDSLAGRLRFPGLRGGYVRVRGTRQLELHGVSWIEGVHVSGTISSRGHAVLSVAGPVSGVVRYSRGRVSGVLGGRSFG